MDIRNWPLARILQLPDWCFGRRWPIMLRLELGVAATGYLISDMALPDRCVLWEVIIKSIAVNAAQVSGRAEVQVALGDQLPAGATAAAIFAAYENMFPGVEGLRNAIPSIGRLSKLRTVYHAQGRRVVVFFDNRSTQTRDFIVVMVFSSIPTEVPDWLISGAGRSL